MLAGAGWWAVRRRAAPEPGLRWLDASSSPIVAALIPAVLAGSLPTDPAARGSARREVLEAFDRAVAGLAPAIQAEVAQLFALLSIPPLRLALAGLASSWEEASPEDVSAFLDRWRASRFALLRAACQSLSQLIIAAWYGNPAAWAAIGYPGPPALEGNSA